MTTRSPIRIGTPRKLCMGGWVAGKAGVSYLRAALLLVRMTLFSTFREKMTALKMKNIFTKMNDASSLIQCPPEKVPYRNEAEIKNQRLFHR